MKPTLGLVMAGLGALLGACASSTPSGLSGPPAVRAAREPEGIRAFEKQQWERAIALEQQGAWFEATQAWEVLALLRPGEYGAQRASLQRRIDTRVQELLARASQEHKHGDAAQAEQLYLGVVSLQPTNSQAAEALRAIERTRLRQDHLLKAGRTLAPAEGAHRRSDPSVPGNPPLMEQAATLANQGGLDEAIELMAGQLKAVPGDHAARDLLADLLYKKAQSLPAKDADAVFKRCLQVSPKHPGCAAQHAAAPAKPASAARR